MHIDITRDTFRRAHHFARVLALQGRVQLDADWNEQVAILWDYLRTLTADLVGEAWGPDDSYRIAPTGQDDASPVNFRFEAAAGTYYVRGLLTHNPPGWGEAALALTIPFAANGRRLIALRVRERLVTAVEDDFIREVALGGADTAARTRVAQDLRPRPAPDKVDANTALYYRIDPARARMLLDPAAAADPGRLQAQLRPADGDRAPCVIAASARYRGLENQLYRVEIHDSGKPAEKGGATFLWSRDNGSVLAAWVASEGPAVVVEGVGREGLSGFAPGQWVQLLDDDYDGVDAPDPANPLKADRGLFKIQTVDDWAGGPDDSTAGVKLTLAGTSPPPSPADPSKHPKVRRWDSPGALSLKGPTDNDGYVPLEAGIEVKFEDDKTYTRGDYWLIPARTALAGGIEWPPAKPAPAAAGADESSKPAPFVPAPLPPRRPESWEAPLAYVGFQKSGAPPVLIDLRKGPHGPASPEPPTPPVLPDAQKADVAAPGTATALFRLFASGAVTYKPTTDSGGAVTGWDAGSPRADLYDEQGQPAGILYKARAGANPGAWVWRAPDASQVAADVAAAGTKKHDAPDKANDLGWFLAAAIGPSAFGLFAPVKLIQQVFTAGGQTPSGTPSTASDVREQNFLATYYFYKT